MRRKIDTWLLVGVISLVLFGIVMVYSSSVIVGLTKFQDGQFFFKRDLLYAAIGIIFCALAANLKYDWWQKLAPYLLGVTFLLLLSVFLFSSGEINGANRWISIGSFSFQPSELAKFTLIAYLSAWLAGRKGKVTSFTESFLPFLIVMFGISVLMVMQPDLGSLTVMVVAATAIYWVAGMTWKQFGIGCVVAVLGLAMLLSTPYRKDRLTAFISPEQDTTGVSYHIKQISLAIGSGGWFGLGFGESKQKRLFLPEPYTDSIFAITVEELGFIVSTFLIAIYTMVIYRGYRVASLAPDDFSKYLATGITTWFGYQAYLNMAAMLQILPLKGLPLPFVSYGGTNLIVSLIAAGVLFNISRYLVDPDSAEPIPRRQDRHVKPRSYQHE